MKPLKLLLLLPVFIFTISCSYDADDKLEINNDNKPSFNTLEVIDVDSDLYQDLKEIATNQDVPHLYIACIDFIYPLTLYVFDETDTYVSTHNILDDAVFSEVLESLAIDYSISISFPITSTLYSGEEIIINTKEELKEAIDSCLNEELITECNSLLQNCVWKVGYSYSYYNTYLGGIFREEDGATTFTMDGIEFNGSWTVFIIENELHININLINTDETGDFFNMDWKVSYLDENSMSLTNGERELVLNQRCDSNFETCTNFVFEECETEPANEISEFILDDYTPCIFDTLELDEAFVITYYETEDNALNMENIIALDTPYTNLENNQSIYVRIDDTDNDLQYYVIITLVAISC